MHYRPLSRNGITYGRIPYRGAAGGSNFANETGAKSGEGSGKFAQARTTKANKFWDPVLQGEEKPKKNWESWHVAAMDATVEKSNVANIPSFNDESLRNSKIPFLPCLFKYFFPLTFFYDTMVYFTRRDVTLCAPGWSIFSNREPFRILYDSIFVASISRHKINNSFRARKQ